MERKTQALTGTFINSRLTAREMALKGSDCNTTLCLSPALVSQVRRLNRDGLGLVNRLIAFKESILCSVNSCGIIDSISISPQECYTLDILYGAGSFNGMIGDAIFHCHLYPHFHEGMWTLWRVFDRLQDGSGVYPDGTPIEALMPLECGVSFAPTLSKMTICSRSAADVMPSARRPRRRMRLSAALKSPPYKRILFTTASEIMIRRA